jgi:hypothetical protein
MFKGAKTFSGTSELITAIDKIIPPDLILSPSSENIRYRHVIKGKDHFYILFNEEAGEVTTKIKVQAAGMLQWLDPATAEAFSTQQEEIVHFKPHELKILRVNNYFKLPPI